MSAWKSVIACAICKHLASPAVVKDVKRVQ